MSQTLKAPFPWFGGKSKVADMVWQRFGDVPNYVEPFFGSGAVLLARPHDAKNETVNDKDCLLANFWRATQKAPEEVAGFADWPVNEADLHARHLWLTNQAGFQEEMKTDPDLFDAKIAGWWVWGISQWIGSGWCSKPGWHGRSGGERSPRGIHSSRHFPKGDLWRTRPNLNSVNLQDRMPSRQIPDISGDGGASGRGIFSVYADDVYGYMQAIADRMRRTRVCCGDWKRILGPSPTTCIGVTGVFLDPPYGVQRADVYNSESLEVSAEVRQWAIEHGDDPSLRIALCGYEGEHEMPAAWERVAWKANGGYANQSSKTRGRENATKERIWFSPHCLHPDQLLFPELRAAEVLLESNSPLDGGAPN